MILAKVSHVNYTTKTCFYLTVNTLTESHKNTFTTLFVYRNNWKINVSSSKLKNSESYSITQFFDSCPCVLLIWFILEIASIFLKEFEKLQLLKIIHCNSFNIFLTAKGLLDHLKMNLHFLLYVQKKTSHVMIKTCALATFNSFLIFQIAHFNGRN